MNRYFSSAIRTCLTGIFCFLFFNITNGQEETEIPINKCVRLEGGFVVTHQTGGSAGINLGGSANYSYCIRMGKHAGIGGGSAAIIFDRQVYLPLYLETVFIVNQKSHSPFVSLEGGYSLGWNNRYKDYLKYRSEGGIYYSAGIGWRFRIGDQFFFYSGISYRHQNSSFYYEQLSGATIHNTASYNLVVLNLGLMLEQR